MKNTSLNQWPGGGFILWNLSLGMDTEDPSSSPGEDVTLIWDLHHSLALILLSPLLQSPSPSHLKDWAPILTPPASSLFSLHGFPGNVISALGFVCPL